MNPQAEPAEGPIDADYRQEMIEAAGLESVQFLTGCCIHQSQALLEGHLLPATGVAPVNGSICHRLAGSCAAVGLSAMAQAWYGLEHLLERSNEADGLDASALTVAWNLAEQATRETEQAYAQERRVADAAQTGSSR